MASKISSVSTQTLPYGMSVLRLVDLAADGNSTQHRIVPPIPVRSDRPQDNLTDFVHVAEFDDGSPDDDRPGTFGNGTRSDKIDYLLMSPAVFERAISAAIFRKGVGW
jgi:hypothetical protein